MLPVLSPSARDLKLVERFAEAAQSAVASHFNEAFLDQVGNDPAEGAAGKSHVASITVTKDKGGVILLTVFVVEFASLAEEIR